jgi:orotate phosphoribosyltransferase
MNPSLKRLILLMYDKESPLITFEDSWLKHHEVIPDAPPSPFKINLRTPFHPTNPGNLTPALFNDFVFLLIDVIEKNKIKFDFIAGIPRAGEPFARALSWILGKPLLVLEKIEKDDGKRKIGGIISKIPFKKGQVVLLVDDLISKGVTKDESIDPFKRAGLRVIICVCIDREEGGASRYRRLGQPFHAGLLVSQILAVGFQESKMFESEYIDCVTYLQYSRENY